MEQTKTDADCEIIEVPNLAKQKTTITGSGGGVDLAAIARAEAALEELSVQFDDWLEDEVGRLSEARDSVRTHGLVDPHQDSLFRAAHDIKGQGETLGYPLAATICNSLCRLLNAPCDKSAIPMSIIDSHVDAVRRVMHDRIKEADHPMGLAVAERLIDVVLEFVEHQEAKENAQDGPT
jgi:chemotaxis protein histidine kinase CheA